MKIVKHHKTYERKMLPCTQGLFVGANTLKMVNKHYNHETNVQNHNWSSEFATWSLEFATWSLEFASWSLEFAS